VPLGSAIFEHRCISLVNLSLRGSGQPCVLSGTTKLLAHFSYFWLACFAVLCLQNRLKKQSKYRAERTRFCFFAKYCLNSGFWDQWLLGTKIINLGSLLVTFGDFWAPFWGFGTSWERFGDGIDFRPFSGGIYHPFGVPFWHPKSQKVAKNTKKQCPESGAEKRVLPELARIGPMCDPYSKYHMFGEVEESPFWWLLVSFWLPFGVTFGHFLQKVAIRRHQKTNLKKGPKIDEKRERG